MVLPLFILVGSQDDLTHWKEGIPSPATKPDSNQGAT